jgi:hypothetical protein
MLTDLPEFRAERTAVTRAANKGELIDPTKSRYRIMTVQNAMSYAGVTRVTLANWRKRGWLTDDHVCKIERGYYWWDVNRLNEIADMPAYYRVNTARPLEEHRVSKYELASDLRHTHEPGEHRVLSLREVAAYAGVSHWTVTELLRTGILDYPVYEWTQDAERCYDLDELTKMAYLWQGMEFNEIARQDYVDEFIQLELKTSREAKQALRQLAEDFEAEWAPERILKAKSGNSKKRKHVKSEDDLDGTKVRINASQGRARPASVEYDPDDPASVAEALRLNRQGHIIKPIPSKRIV